jgi:hypothetical protein
MSSYQLAWAADEDIEYAVGTEKRDPDWVNLYLSLND